MDEIGNDLVLVLDWAGDVLPCPRPRMGFPGRAYLPKAYLEQKRAMTLKFKEQATEQGVVTPIPPPVLVIQRFSGKLHQGRDLDNLAKGVNDALVCAGVLKSDNLKNVCGLFALFDWNQRSPGLRVQVTAIRSYTSKDLVNLLNQSI